MLEGKLEEKTPTGFGLAAGVTTGGLLEPGAESELAVGSYVLTGSGALNDSGVLAGSGAALLDWLLLIEGLKDATGFGAGEELKELSEKLLLMAGLGGTGTLLLKDDVGFAAGLSKFGLVAVGSKLIFTGLELFELVLLLPALKLSLGGID